MTAVDSMSNKFKQKNSENINYNADCNKTVRQRENKRPSKCVFDKKKKQRIGLRYARDNCHDK